MGFIPGFEAEIETPFGRIVDPNAVVWQISEQYGAVSRASVVKYNDAIYFLTSKKKIMVFDGELREISIPVEDRIDSMFADYDAMVNYARLVGQYDALKLTNDSTGDVLSLDLPSQKWGHEEFTLFTPERMFIYDSVNSAVSEISFADGIGPFLRQYRDGTRNDQAGKISWAAEIPIPGDGLNMYSVNRLNFRMKPRSAWFLRFTVYDADGDSLLSDSILSTTAAFYKNRRFLRWSLGLHDPTMYPFVRLWGKVDDNIGDEPPIVVTNLFDIESIVFTVEKTADFEIQ